MTMRHIPYGTQRIDEDDMAAVSEVLKSEYLTTGSKVAGFETALAETVGAKYAVATANGTAALHIAALAAGIGEGDEAITTPLTFAASANCVLYCGGQPVFADIDPATMLMDMEDVKRKISPKTKAIIPVHYGGELCDMASIEKLANEYGLAVIQDGAHSLGGTFAYGAKRVRQGEYDGMQIWSFHPVKTITTGEGGAVTTNDNFLYDRLIRLRSHGITRDTELFAGAGGWDYDMLELGYNYRLTDIQCALGISQLKKLDIFAKRRAEIVERYNEAFAGLPLDIQATPNWSQPVRHLYTIRVRYDIQRPGVYNKLKERGIGVNVHYKPVYRLRHYQNLGYKKGLCPHAEDAYERMITIPLFAAMTDEEVEYVIKCVNESI